MKGYKTSKDYHRLKELLDEGYMIICITDYDWGGGSIGRDICVARHNYGEYRIYTRGLEYTSWWPGMEQYKSFEDACEDCNIEFIEPNGEE